MSIYKGAEKITKIRRGDVVVGKIRRGKELVYQSKKIYTITYIFDGVETKETVKEGDSVLAPSFAPSKSGYTFLGWSTSKTSKAVESALTATKDMTLYAVFKYPDAVLLSSDNKVNISTNNTTLFAINTNLYPTHNVTAIANDGYNLFNTTSGLVYRTIYLDGTEVRRRSRYGANAPSEVSGYVGTNGVEFTLSNKSGNVTGYYSGAGTTDQSEKISITIKKVTGIGATIVG